MIDNNIASAPSLQHIGADIGITGSLFSNFYFLFKFIFMFLVCVTMLSMFLR